MTIFGTVDDTVIGQIEFQEDGSHNGGLPTLTAQEGRCSPADSSKRVEALHHRRAETDISEMTDCAVVRLRAEAAVPP
jgi:hypothetical protein